MSDRIESASGPAFRPGYSPAEEGSASLGNWRGETVRAESGPDYASLIDAAKEELGFGLSEEMEEKKIEERIVDEGRYGERVDEIEGVWKFLGHLPDLDLDALREMINELEEAGQSPDDILATVGRHFSDPSHIFAALDTAEQSFRARGRTDLADAIAAAKAQFQALNGPAIQAGLNVSAAAFEIAAGDREAAGELRDLYRDTVFKSDGPAAVYKGIIDQFGIEGFPERLRFLTRALGDDLAAEGPSVEPIRLQELVGDLSELRVLDTVHERCGELVDRLERQNQVTLSPTGVMQELLPLTTDPVSGPSKPLALPGRLGIGDDKVEAGIALLRESRDILAMVPTAIYRDLDARGSALRAMQEAMDILIEREEQMA